MPDISREDVRNLARQRIGGGKMRHRINLLGAGGVGSNVLRFAARTRTYNSMYERMMFRVYDHDTVELHNLNRTQLFRLDAVGRTEKVNAIREALATITNGGNDATRALADASTERVGPETKLTTGTIIDARDTIDPSCMIPGTWLKLAYDGGSAMSFTFRPDIVAKKVVVLQGGNSYAVTPSFYVPAAILALMAIRFLEFRNFADITEHRAGTYTTDIDELARSVSFAWSPDGEEDE
jgi:hypothetical protein